MKTYLHPKAMRCGSESMFFIKSEPSAAHPSRRLYWLGCYFNLAASHPCPCLGSGKEYDEVHSTRISEECYRALLKQARENRRRFRAD
jgi:hypothetical protein